MILTWDTPESVVAEHAEEIEHGAIRVILFFLGTKLDGKFLDSINELSKELDALTGRYCLAVTFVPPPESLLRSGRYRRFIADGKRWPPEQWENFKDVMTQRSYDVADLFSVPYNNMPCLLFVNRSARDRVAVLRLRDSSLDDLIPKLRGLFSDWHREHLQLLDRCYYLRAILDKGSRTKGLPERIKDEVHRVLRNTVIREFGEALQLSAKLAGLPVEKAQSGVKRLGTQPQEFRRIIDYLKINSLEVSFRGHVLTCTNVAAVLRSEYDAALRQGDPTEELKQCEANLPDFPLERVQKIDASVRVIKIVNWFGRQISFKKIEIDPWAIIKRFLGFGGDEGKKEKTD
jgi:hypothetical protein